MPNYCTAAAAKDHAQIPRTVFGYGTEAEYTSLVEALIDRAERIIDDYCQVPSALFKSGGLTVTDELYDSDGGDTLTLRNRPVVSVTSLRKNTAALTEAPSWTTLTEGPGANTHFLPYKEEGRLYIYSGAAGEGKQRYRVTYVAGFSALPKNVEQAAVEMTANMLHILANRKKALAGTLGDFDINVVGDEAFTARVKMLLQRHTRTHVVRG